MKSNIFNLTSKSEKYAVATRGARDGIGRRFEAGGGITGTGIDVGKFFHGLRNHTGTFAARTLTVGHRRQQKAPQKKHFDFLEIKTQLLRK